ncbi:MAG: hypothetical protein HYR91_15460 [Flavobacteriia bacterium]|nr:hypothetical protein [Flavobacteriia bacterium]
MSFLLAFGVYSQTLNKRDYTKTLNDTVVPNHESVLDSILNHYFSNSQNNADSILKNQINNSIDRIDSIEPNQLKDLIQDYSGKVGIGYQYGLLTGYIDTTSSSAMNVLTSRADMEVTTLGIPINFSYNYSSFRNPLGVNNYIRASVNLEKYKQLKAIQRDELKKKLDSKISQTTESRDQLKGKLGYSEILLQRVKTEIEKKERELEQQAKDSLMASKNQGKEIIGDSLANHSSKTDSLQMEYKQKKTELEKYKKLYDSLQNTYSRIINTYEKLDGLIHQYEDKKDVIDNYNANGLKTLGGNWLKNVTKLDVGLTYPSTTGLTQNSVPIKGIDFENQKGNWYLAVTAGITMNNLMVTNDVIQNKLINSKNLFNQFDYQSIRQKRFLTQIKTGWGTKEGTHAFIGVRYTNKAVIPTEVIDTTTINPSAGIEIDLRYKPTFIKGSTIDLIYGKTSDTHLDNGIIKPPFTTLFSSSRTHTGLLKIGQSIPKFRTYLSGAMRWIDPHADMASLGVLQPNNLRYELQSKHAILNNLDLGFTYRKDRNNIDNKLDSTIQLQMFGGNFTGKASENILFFGNYNYLTQQTKRIASSSKMTDNYTYTMGITAMYSIDEYKNAATLLYNEYKITSLQGEGLYKNYEFQHLTRFENGQNKFSVGVFKMSEVGANMKKAVIIGNEWVIKREKYQLTLGMKISYSKEYGDDLGGKIEITRMFSKHLQWNFKAEKFIKGNFYSSYDPNRFANVPYTIITQLNYIMK